MAVSDALRLKLYNAALTRHLGERKLSSLTDNAQTRRNLDDVWDSGEIVNEWLSEGLWNFAIRTSELQYESAYEPDFGYQYQFVKPNDCIRLAMIANDEYFSFPITRYEDEAGYWYCDLQTLYVSYVSNDDSYGNNTGNWTEKFKRFCEVDLAVKIMHRSTGLSDEDQDKLMKAHVRLKLEAKNLDAMDEPARFPAHGSWVRSRWGRNVTLRSRSDGV